jgi:mevalonate-3-kinase
MKQQSKAVAYPGLPVIFAEGFRDYKQRISFHSHASLAITDIHDNAKAETSAELAPEGVLFTLNGVPPEGSRADGIYRLIGDMLALATDRTGVRIDSENHNILTGSSDSGAAALVTALDDLLELGLPMTRMIEISRHVSETAYRSLIGGLSRFNVDRNGNFKTVKIREASFFDELMIYALPFEGIKRFTADDLHLRIVRHKQYGQRAQQVEERLNQLNRLMDENDLLGFMDLMEAEAWTIHTMFKEMGMEVVKPEMKEAIDLVGAMKQRGIPAFWNVAGGSCVYVFTVKKWSKEVTRELKDKNYKYRHYKVADGAKPI